MEYGQYLERKREIAEAKQAAARCWSVVLGHLFFAPASSLYYAVKTSNWKPFGWATGLAVLCTPIAVVDAGITLSLAPPITSAAMIITNTKNQRRKLQIFAPEQADAIVFEKQLAK